MASDCQQINGRMKRIKACGTTSVPGAKRVDFGPHHLHTSSGYSQVGVVCDSICLRTLVRSSHTEPTLVMTCVFSGRFECRFEGFTILIIDLPIVAYTLSIRIITSFVTRQSLSVKRPRDIVRSLTSKSVETTVWKLQTRKYL
jgi:hypothetical protein